MSSTLNDHQNIDPQPDHERIMREILDARARLLAGSLTDETLASEFVEVLKFSVGRDRFAVETRFVTEVLRDISVTPLPGNPDPLLGLANLRGEVLAIMSLSGVLTLRSEIDADQMGDWIIVLGIDQAMFGIAVTEVSEVIAFEHGQILESSTGSMISNPGLIRGVTEDARMILHGNELLEASEFVIDQE